MEYEYEYNAESEKIVLGSIFAEPELLKECILAPGYFGTNKHKTLFEIFREMEKQNIPIDIGTIFEVAGSRRLELMGGIGTIALLADYKTTNFQHHQAIILEHFKNKKMREIGLYITQTTGDVDINTLVGEVTKRFSALEEIGGGNEGDEERLVNILLQTHDWMEMDHGKIAGATTGYRDLDRILSGMKKQDLIIVGARPSVGKTAFAVNVGINYTSSLPTETQPHGGPVALFSLEMNDVQITLRMLSNVGRIDAQRIRNPKENFTADDWNRSMRAMAHLGSKPFYIFDKPGANLTYIRQKLRYMKNAYKGQHVVVIIDYLQLITGDPKFKGNRQQEVSDISKELKTLAREFDMTIIALSQLSRKVEERADKRPVLSDLRESGSIEQDADVIAFLYREDYYDKETEEQNIIEINVAKQRNGPVGTVSLAFVKENSKFVNIG